MKGLHIPNGLEAFLWRLEQSGIKPEIAKLEDGITVMRVKYTEKDIYETHYGPCTYVTDFVFSSGYLLGMKTTDLPKEEGSLSQSTAYAMGEPTWTLTSTLGKLKKVDPPNNHVQVANIGLYLPEAIDGIALIHDALNDSHWDRLANFLTDTPPNTEFIHATFEENGLVYGNDTYGYLLALYSMCRHSNKQDDNSTSIIVHLPDGRDREATAPLLLSPDQCETMRFLCEDPLGFLQLKELGPQFINYR